MPPPSPPPLDCAGCDAGWTTCGVCLRALNPSECPADPNAFANAHCNDPLAIGQLCEYDAGNFCSDGDGSLDNCAGGFDMYIAVDCHAPPPSPPPPSPPPPLDCSGCDAGWTSCGLCLMAVHPNDCPSAQNPPLTDDIQHCNPPMVIGEQCEWDSPNGCQGGDGSLDNCGSGFDIYVVVDCHSPPPSPPPPSPPPPSPEAPPPAPPPMGCDACDIGWTSCGLCLMAASQCPPPDLVNTVDCNSGIGLQVRQPRPAVAALLSHTHLAQTHHPNTRRWDNSVSGMPNTTASAVCGTWTTAVTRAPIAPTTFT